MPKIPITSKWIDLSLLHPAFLERLDNLFKDERIAGYVEVCSGCRSYAEQKRLYDKYRAGKGNLAANPDWKRPDGFFRGSFHQEQPDGYSYAVDLSIIKWGGPSKADVTRIAEGYGIRPTVKNRDGSIKEWWHFQPRDGDGWFDVVAYPEREGVTKQPMDWAAILAWHKAMGDSIALAPVSRGSKGPEVKIVQQRLNALDFWCGKADGIFGWKTKAAVKRFQRTVLMPVNGRVGATTWHRMWNPEVPDGL